MSKPNPQSPLNRRIASISPLVSQPRLAWTPPRDTQRGFSVASPWATHLPSRRV